MSQGLFSWLFPKSVGLVPFSPWFSTYFTWAFHGVFLVWKLNIILFDSHFYLGNWCVFPQFLRFFFSFFVPKTTLNQSCWVHLSPGGCDRWLNDHLFGCGQRGGGAGSAHDTFHHSHLGRVGRFFSGIRTPKWPKTIQVEDLFHTLPIDIFTVHRNIL